MEEIGCKVISGASMVSMTLGSEKLIRVMYVILDTTINNSSNVRLNVNVNKLRLWLCVGKNEIIGKNYNK